MKTNTTTEDYPPNLGNRRLWESRDELAIRIYQILAFWLHEDNERIRESVFKASNLPFKVTLASSISSALRHDFEIESRTLYVASGKDAWYRKLCRAFCRAYWALRYWYI